jgi:hypothetical protein
MHDAVDGVTGHGNYFPPYHELKISNHICHNFSIKEKTYISKYKISESDLHIYLPFKTVTVLIKKTVHCYSFAF